MKRVLVLCFIAFFLGQLSYGQDVYKIGGTSVEPDGAEVLTTNLKILNLSLSNEVSMAMRAKTLNGNLSRFLYVTVPYKQIDLPEGASLEFTLKDGNKLTFPVERKMVWSVDHVVVHGGKGDANVIRIPFRISDEQLDQLCSAQVTYVTIHSVPEEVSFKPRSNYLVANVTKSLRSELNKMESSHSSFTDASSARTSTNSGNGPKYQIHETPNTKVFTVNDLSQTLFGNCYNGVFSVYEKDTHTNHIFDRDGKLLGDVRSLDILNFYDGRLTIGKPDIPGREIYIIDRNGTLVKNIHHPDYEAYAGFIDGVAVIRKWEMGSGLNWHDIRFVNEKGDYILEQISGSVINAYVGDLKSNRRSFRKPSGFNYGYADQSGKIVIQPIYNEGASFSEGLAAVAKKEGDKTKWGFIDLNGNVVIPFKFNNEPSVFKEGLSVAVKQNGRYVYINKSGEPVSPEYRDATVFCNGIAWVQMLDGSFSLIDKEFNQKRRMDNLVEFSKDYDSCASFNLIQAKTKERYSSEKRGLYSYDTGDLLLDLSAGYSLSPLNTTDTVFFYSSNREGEVFNGYINAQGEIIIKFIQSEF